MAAANIDEDIKVVPEDESIDSEGLRFFTLGRHAHMMQTFPSRSRHEIPMVSLAWRVIDYHTFVTPINKYSLAPMASRDLRC